MPEISRFFGIVIKMFWNDHFPPHFHAYYAGDEALVEITTLSIFAGHLPPRAIGLVVEWAALHQAALIENWRRSREMETLQSIEPLG